jgi:ribosomal protein S18 acetylase RimI-like enzyme
VKRAPRRRERPGVPEWTSPRIAAFLASESEAPVVQACLDAAADYFAAAEGRPVGPKEGIDLCAEAAADSTRRLFLLRESREAIPAGLLSLVLDYPEPGEATIALLALRPERRRQGLGRELVVALGDWLRRRQIQTLRLGVRQGAEGAAEFWQAVGFEETPSVYGVREFMFRL